ncbi:MAG: serine hydrolase [Planctomycetes bacterium]|nr:serine hydrolase [Planctomycetota bacterium]
MARRLFLVTAILACFHSPCNAQDGEQSLPAKLKALAAAHKGKVAIAFKTLTGDECFYLDADEAMPTASLIKFPILIEAYYQLQAGKIDFNETLTLSGKDKAPGAGVLTPHFSTGATFPLKDVVRLMMVFSDNTATNMVLDKIGLRSVNERMAALDCPNTRVNAKVFLGSTTSIDPERTKKFGLGSTTAREMVTLLEKLHQGKLASAEACKEMIATMKKCDDWQKLRRFLPEDLPVAHKTGAVAKVRTDAGILYLKSGPVAVCVMTNENKDERRTRDNDAEILIGKVAKEIYDHYSR